MWKFNDNNDDVHKLFKQVYELFVVLHSANGNSVIQEHTNQSMKIRTWICHVRPPTDDNSGGGRAA